MSWKGPIEKKWEWYKHTKPCNNMIYLKSCTTLDCNYAHTLDQYVDAILKRNFKLDFEIINQLKEVDINSPLNIDVDMGVEQDLSKKRQRSYAEVSISKKARTE